MYLILIAVAENAVWTEMNPQLGNLKWKGQGDGEKKMKMISELQENQVFLDLIR